MNEQENVKESPKQEAAGEDEVRVGEPEPQAGPKLQEDASLLELQKRLENKRILRVVLGGILFSIAVMPIDIRAGIGLLICDIILLPFIVMIIRPIVQSRVRSEIETIKEGLEKARRGPV